MEDMNNNIIIYGNECHRCKANSVLIASTLFMFKQCAKMETMSGH